MAILDDTAQMWRDALGIAEGNEPAALILEGTWWREKATKARLAHLDDVRELSFPDMFLGTWRGRDVVYCCAYGAPRAVEPAHIFAQIGVKTLVQIGTCGSLDHDAVTGTVALPETCIARDGVSQHYGAGPLLSTDQALVTRAEAGLAKLGATTLRTKHLTWPSLFAQSDAMCADWAGEGISTIDMATTAVIAAGNRFGASTVSLLTVWDVLSHGRTFMDPLPPDDAAQLARSNEQVFEVALGVAEAAEPA